MIDSLTNILSTILGSALSYLGIKRLLECIRHTASIPEGHTTFEVVLVSIGILLLGLALLYYGLLRHIRKRIKQQRAYEAWVEKTSSASMQEVDRMNGERFELFCGELLKKYGFSVSYTKGSGDQGVDIIAQKDGIKYAVQCKRYNNKLGNTPVQEVYAGARYYECNVPIVMTNSYFTKGAIDAARATGVRLWDRDKIMDLHFGAKE